MRYLALFAIIALSACSPERGFIIGYTDHVGAETGAEFDEGAGIRGGGVSGTVGPVEVSGSAYRQSVPDGGMGFTLAVAPADPWIDLGPVNARPIVQANYYPEKPFGMLEETGGFFGAAGVSVRTEMDNGLGAFVNIYPTIGRESSFDYLAVAGVSWDLGG